MPIPSPAPGDENRLRPRLRPWFFILGWILATPFQTSAADDNIALAGRWRFGLDRQDAGLAERWFERSLPDSIRLPGSLPGQGIGDPVTVDTKWTGGIVDRSWFTAPEYAPYRRPGNVKVPFWLQPETHYTGAAWFQWDIEIPKRWPNQRVVLFLERAHWETRVWLDGRLIGTNRALATPHEYDLGPLVPGKKRLTIRVDNRMVIDIGENSHSVSDHTQGNWNGIVGRIELRATPLVWLEDLQAYPDAARGLVRVKGRLGNASGRTGAGTLSMRVTEAIEPGFQPPPDWIKQDVTWQNDGGSFEVEIPVSQPKLWDEFQQPLYHLEARLEETQARRTVAFGFRDLSTRGTQFLVNGRKTFLRGTLECAIFPKTGHTPTDLESWRNVIKAAKAFGLNNLRFHSHCPPEAAFVAADELGMYLHVECSSWPNQTSTLGDGKPVDRWIYEEADHILRAYGNHPSFLLLLAGNEPGGRNHVAYLKKWVEHQKSQDPRRLYSSGAGWPQIPENQFDVTPAPRIQAWGEGLKSRINARPPETRTDYRGIIQARSGPVISHEIGQWCAYPNFDEIRKYTGYLKPRNFEIFRESLNAHHLADQARPFLLASGKLQTLCYKEDIESALRTPGMGGFQLLDLHDFPGQGTALVGVLDPFWEEKGYVTAAQYRRFCNSTVPLARLDKRIFTTAEKLEADLEVAHFGAAPLGHAVTRWRLVSAAGKSVAAGSLPAKTLPVDNGIALGHLSVELQNLPAPARYQLVITITGQLAASTDQAVAPARWSPLSFENDWDIWVLPAAIDTSIPADITVVHDLDDPARAALDRGGKVLLLVPPAQVKGGGRGPIALGFSSIFWNTAWTQRQAPHTLGILCKPQHPLFAAFPTEDHSNWQWWYLVTRASPMILDELPSALRPTVQVIDDWVTNRKLGLVFEAKVGAGRLLVCSIDLERDLAANPVARQFRASLLRYMSSGAFKPKVGLTPEQARGLMTRSASP